MSVNPYQPPHEFDDVEDSVERDGESLINPKAAYTAASNLDAYAAAEYLRSKEIDAHVVEDQSGIGAFNFGLATQFHRPQVFVEESDLDTATVLMAEFDRRRHERYQQQKNAPPIEAVCEECERTSMFPATQDGTTQTCPHCHAHMDVGDLGWPEDFDFGEPETPELVHEDLNSAMDAATELNLAGHWQSAIDTYRDIAARWPEQTEYVNACILELQQKIYDAGPQ